MKLHRYVDHQRLHIVTKDVISLSISVLLLFRHYISHKITFGAPSSGGVLRSACGAFIGSTSAKAYRHWVSCDRNYYGFSFVFLKLYRCLCQGLKMCMMFGCNPQINFCHFSHSLNLVIFGSTSARAYRHWVSCERNFYSFSRVLLKLYRCLCQGLKMCMMFGCNPQINF